MVILLSKISHPSHSRLHKSTLNLCRRQNLNLGPDQDQISWSLRLLEVSSCPTWTEAVKHIGSSRGRQDVSRPCWTSLVKSVGRGTVAIKAAKYRRSLSFRQRPFSVSGIGISFVCINFVLFLFGINFSVIEDNTGRSSSAHTETSSLDMDLYQF